MEARAAPESIHCEQNNFSGRVRRRLHCDRIFHVYRGCSGAKLLPVEPRLDGEFNQPDGSPPDPTKWGYDLGSNGINSELEYLSALI
jgi:hypothetical protein